MPKSATAYTLADRRRRIVGVMADAGIDRLVCAGNGHHMIDLANPIAHVLGYRSVGPALLTIDRDGTVRLLTSPADEIEVICALDLAEHQARDEIAAAIPSFLGGTRGSLATIGLDALHRRLAEVVTDAAGAVPRSLDVEIYAATAAKTDEEIAATRRATAIAEAGYERLLQLARPGIRECDLAVEVNFRMREMGANDSFLMLNCGPRADAVMPSSERAIEAGDLLLCELSPSVAGQFTQICRTVSIGEPKRETVEKYALLVAAMNEGISRVRPNARMGDVCLAIDDYLSAAGYAQYSRPPFIRRRGHGLGSASTAPGDVSVDNDTVLEPGMLFMVHPNQFLPETGYMMCGEPVLVGESGAEVLTEKQAAFAIAKGAA